LRENTQGLCAGKGTAFSGRYKQKKRFASTLIIFKQANEPLGHDGGASELPSPARGRICAAANCGGAQTWSGCMFRPDLNC
jgi:hypothetical protein